MEYRFTTPERLAFLEELGVDFKHGEGKWKDFYFCETPDLTGWHKQSDVFYCMAKTIEDIKFRQAKEGSALGWEFPIYDHVLLLKDRKGEPIFGFTPYHSRRIIGFMPPWMRLSEHSVYMGEGTIWAPASEIPEEYDEEMAIKLMMMPPLDTEYGVAYKDILRIRAFNLSRLGTGPYAVDLESLKRLEEK